MRKCEQRCKEKKIEADNDSRMVCLPTESHQVLGEMVSGGVRDGTPHPLPPYRIINLYKY